MFFSSSDECINMPSELNDVQPRFGRRDTNDDDCCDGSCVVVSHASDIGTRLSDDDAPSLFL